MKMVPDSYCYIFLQPWSTANNLPPPLTHRKLQLTKDKWEQRSLHIEESDNHPMASFGAIMNAVRDISLK